MSYYEELYSAYHKALLKDLNFKGLSKEDYNKFQFWKILKEAYTYYRNVGTEVEIEQRKVREEAISKLKDVGLDDFLTHFQDRTDWNHVAQPEISEQELGLLKSKWPSKYHEIISKDFHLSAPENNKLN